MNKLIYLIALLAINFAGMAQTNTYIGTVLSATDRRPVTGVNIHIKGNQTRAITDSLGNFKIATDLKTPTLLISYIGYLSREITIKDEKSIVVLLTENETLLNEIIVSTGYQELRKERATGSFVQINRELLDRKVTTDILSRLEDLVPGLNFNRGKAEGLTIRGQSTISSKADPLIVIDNFPYEGDLQNINPNDVESITILKDAAAASIWGARAGNGVIVITTKKAKYSQALQVSFNANFTSGAKPDLFYVPKMNVSDYIDTEIKLFNQGYYQSNELSVNKVALSPVVELLIAKRENKINETQFSETIAQFKQQDVRNDINHYLNRNLFNSQYSLNLSGGSENQRYLISAGRDRNLSGQIGNTYIRTTVNATNTYSFLDRRLELTTSMYYTNSKNTLNAATASGASGYPYNSLADQYGNPLAVSRDYRNGFKQEAEEKGLLNWQYKPLEELKLSDYTTGLADYRLNLGLRYKVVKGLDAEILYQYGKSHVEERNLQGEASYSVRNEINKFSRLDTDGSVKREIPEGGILDISNRSSIAQNLRGQLKFDKVFNNIHQLNLLAGAEITEQLGARQEYRLYGYDDEHATSRIVDFVSPMVQFINPAATAIIPNHDESSEQVNRFLSYYANGAYTFQKRYSISASARLDQSNLFGVKTNQKGVPLYSAGLGWEISKEQFYSLKFLPVLRFRATYGYNGSVNKSVTAFTTARASTAINALTRLPFAGITNPPNPGLRWERVKILNYGLDFQSSRQVFAGSLEYYSKKGMDLIGVTPIQGSSGITRFSGNYAGTQGHGWELLLNTRNLDKTFKWYSNVVFSYSAEHVTDYSINTTALNYISLGDAAGGPVYPLKGNPLYSLYSYAWAGLEQATGDPQGYLNGEVSKDYAKIIAAASPGNLVYNGPARPTVFGALRNELSYKGFSVSVSVSFRSGYYFRRNSISYSNNYGLGGHGDYYKRWQQSGDELTTNVPAMPVTANGNRDLFYLRSSTLVEPGDHIRLQDVNFSYNLGKTNIASLAFRQLRVYAYANNLGLLWTRNSQHIDPDYQNGQMPLTIAGGCKIDF